MEEGICHVCGQKKPLSFEHIPPKSSWNTSRSRCYSDIDSFTRSIKGTGSFEGLHYEQRQQGTGCYALCSECNSYLGRNYVNSFTDFFKAVVVGMLEREIDPEFQCFLFETDKLPPLAFFKQVISNFCSTTQPGSMTNCMDFLLNKESNDFPDEYRLSLYLIPDLRAKRIFTGWMTPILNDFSTCDCSAICIPPFGFTLTRPINRPLAKNHPGDITALFMQPWGETPKLKFTLPILRGDILSTPFLWDSYIDWKASEA